MTAAQCEQAIARGAMLVRATAEAGSNIIGFGEMGIGNTSSATALFAALSDTAIEDCVGRGTGLDDQGLQHKTAVLKAALAKHGALANPFAMLCTFGGFEIAMMVGAILAACEKKMVVMIDGFIASSAAAIAFALEPPARDYCIFSHLSNESGHKKILDYLQVSPLVSLGLRLGEGSGVAVTYPLIQSAVLFLNDMASFDDAGVSNQ
jgi:nicotinate-nucleotide--dimethylbenzimidazole phosphoribosyltransferase